MSSENPTMSSGLSADKGKGKAVEAEDVFMGQEAEDTDSEGSEAGDEDALPEVDEEEEGGDDNLEPISADNIIEGGRRTRGKRINFAEVASKEEDDNAMNDDDDDDDFKPRDEDEEMQG